jgi:uncharacterized protein (DUF885 family)
VSDSESKQSIGVSDEASEQDRRFDELCEQFYHSWFRFHPEEAVTVGIHDFAGLLRSYEHDDIGALIALIQKMLSALTELKFSALGASRQIDYRLIRGALNIELHDLEENDWRYCNPMLYVPVNAIYQLLIHPGGDVHKAIKRRLEAMPEYLRGARVMLSQHPERVVPQWALSARDISLSGADFIRGLGSNPLLTARFTNPARLQRLFDAAAIALNDFASYLKSDVIPKAEGKFASGGYRFHRLLNEMHFLDTSAQKLLRFGERLSQETEQQLLLQSEQICGVQDINTALAKIRMQHPEASQLLDCYREKMQAAHAWLLKADIMTVPEKQSLSVQQTPEFLRELIPFAAYEPPLPQDKEQRGLYYVTTVEHEVLLAEHNHYSIDLTSAHEAFPGHHLQFVVANMHNNSNVTRLLNASATMYEGWALYCEQLVFEQGLYDKKEHRFMQLRDRLWRALRVIIDVKLHTGQFCFDDAVELLVKKLGFDVSQARAEINWYCSSASTPLCYAVGSEIILRTRELLDASDKAKLKQFHDSLLSRGSIALPLVIESVFGEAVWKQVHDDIFGGRDSIAEDIQKIESD